MKVAIIGAGASGLMLAQKLSKNKNINVLIFERNSKPAWKLLASGNGKANISNKNVRADKYNNLGFMNKIMCNISPDDLISEFNQLGLFTTSDIEGRVYPYSYSSSTVLTMLLSNIKSNVIFNYNYQVNSIKYSDGKWIINDYFERFDYVVCSSGSFAGMIEKNQVGVYDYLINSNISLTKLESSLVGFRVHENIKALSGVRIKANCSLFKEDQLIASEYGEIVFKDDGLSGICIMNLSSLYARMAQKDNTFIEIDMTPDISYEILDEYFKKRRKALLDGLLNQKISQYFSKITSIDKMIKIVKHFRLKIDGTYGYNSAQVIHGGVSINLINENLSYKSNKQLYFTGEVIDIDGQCGGYNLFFAFASALIVAKDIISKCK